MGTEERDLAAVHQTAEAALCTGGIEAMLKVILPPGALEEKEDLGRTTQRMLEDHAIASIVGRRGGPAAAVETLMFLRGWDRGK